MSVESLPLLRSVPTVGGFVGSGSVLWALNAREASRVEFIDTASLSLLPAWNVPKARDEQVGRKRVQNRGIAVELNCRKPSFFYL